MENTSVLEAGFRLDDLRVEELEPRLEFTAPDFCGPAYIPAGGQCTSCFYEILPEVYQEVPC
jgi:hypothetical protein